MSDAPRQPPPATLPRAIPHRSPVTWRSILLGLIGVTIICGLTPFNDYALNNTFLVGNNLPIGVVMLSFVFVLAVNGPLNKWRPHWAFSSGELAVALSMTLVSCALPSSGLMRYFPPSLISPFYSSVGNHSFQTLFEQMRVPNWLYPSFEGRGPRQWAVDPIVLGYVTRWTEDGPYPYRAWLRPAVTWGVFLFALYGALVCMVSIVRRQWVENERLPFPLAQIHMALIEQPKPGHVLNTILRTRTFWVGFGVVFGLHLWNGLSVYNPKQLPLIPVYYDVLHRIMSNPPWSYVTGDFKGAAVFFTAVGVTYFLSNSVGFSLWFFFVAMQGWRMIIGTTTGDPNNYGTAGAVDQHFGGITAFVISLLWVGRNHWKMVFMQAIRGPRPGEPRGRYLSFGGAFWGLVGCFCLMVLWLWAAGATLGGSCVMVLLMLTLFLAITRIIAESGLMHGQLQVPINYPWVLAAEYGFPHVSPPSTFFMASMLQTVHFDFREVVPVYASHGIKVIDQAAFHSRDSLDDPKSTRRTGRKIVGLLMLALFVGYVVSFTSTLWMEYKYPWTLDTPGHQPNEWGVVTVPRSHLVDPVVQYDRGIYQRQTRPLGNFVFGFSFVSILSACRLRFAWWPLHPIGYLMLYTYPGTHLWLSILIGWLAKNLILRFGGTRMYTAAKPFFLGIIVGESAAAGMWLVVGIVLNAFGLPYRAVNIMPG